MSRLDGAPLDPEVEAQLDAIDATLAGEPVDPRFAELAELALLVAAERPQPREAFAAELDARVARRFAGPGLNDVRGRPVMAPRRPRRFGWAWGGAAATALAGAIVAIVIAGGGSSNPPTFASSSSASATSAASSAAPAVPRVSSSSGGASSAASSAASASGAGGSAEALHSAPRTPSSNQAASVPATTSASGAYGGATLALPQNGRKTIQSAEVDLGASPSRIDEVGQEVLNVAGAENAIVDHSTVTQTGGLDGNANFQLRVPSAELPDTLRRLSSLADAAVLGRTDNSQDINSTYVSTVRALNDARALRAALLKQLAAAITTAQIDSLKARINDAESQINAQQNALNQLNAQVDYSRLVVTIAARPGVVTPVQHHKSGFTLGHAAHVAGRVLVVAAGVALIALAAGLPVALVVLLLIWLGAALRRRRREHALDLA